jgi:hypothetical protein
MHLLEDLSIVNLIGNSVVSNTQALRITSIDGKTIMVYSIKLKRGIDFLSQALGFLAS